jgi:hypothetical protein
MSDIATSASNTARYAAAAVVTIPLVLSLIYFGGVAIGEPVESDIIPAGHIPISVQVALPTRFPTYGPIAPTSSLANLRCQSWLQDHAGTCPDDATLAGMYWTTMEPAPQTLYVGVLGLCDTARPHFNVEYGEGRLTLHCHYTARLIQPWSGPHSDARPGGRAFVTLVIMPTVEMTAGQVSVYREDRVERRFSDIVSTQLIGAGTIPAA